MGGKDIKKGVHNDDDEISIDFSGIKKWFAKKEKKKQRHDSKSESKTESSSEANSESKPEVKSDSGQAPDKPARGHESDDDEDIQIDFSKVKNFFARKKGKKDAASGTSHSEAADNDNDEDNDEISLNLSKETKDKVKNFFVRFWPYLLILVPVILTIFIRAQTVELTISNDWARGGVYDYYRNAIATQVAQQNPNIPDANKEQMVRDNFNRILKEQSTLIDQQIKELSKQYKEYFQYQSGSTSYTYMGDIDSYYFLRQARNIVEKGHNCDEFVDGKCYDTYTLAPQKLSLPQTLHPWSIAILYKIVKPFNKDFTLMQAQLYVPTVYAVLSVILIYLMMLRLYGTLAALTASILLTVNPIFLTRSLGSDSDIYNIFFPILIIFFAFEAFVTEGGKKKAIYAALAGLSMGAYSFAWIGWWYVFDFIVFAVVVDYIYAYFKSRTHKEKSSIDIMTWLRNEKTISALYTLVPLIITSFLTVSLINGWKSLRVIYHGPFAFSQTKIAANPSLWPNVLTTVAEFNEASIPTIVGQMGGKWFFFLALLGFIILIYKNFKNIAKNIVYFLLSAVLLYFLVTPKGTSLNIYFYLILFALPFLLGAYLAMKSEEESSIKISVLYFVWVAASIYAALKGVRFTLLLVPPIAIGIGITFGLIHDASSRLLANAIKIRRTWISIAIFALLAYYLVNPVQGGIGTAKGYLPNVNDQWWGALTQIKDNSQSDAIINSWWDFGHWFKFIADRRVTLDGSSQNSPQLHWLGKTLLTSDDNQARGMLRMLDCSGNQAFNAINAKINDIPKSVRLENEIMLLKSRQDANKILLERGFSDSEAEKVLDYTHCDAPEDFFITSEDMVGKGGVWAHFGSWNFDRAWMHQIYDLADSESQAVEKFQNEFGMTKEDALNYAGQIRSLNTDADVNAWIAPWPSYLQGEAACANDSEIVTCVVQQLSIKINLTTMDAMIPTPQGPKRLDAFAYTTPTSIVVKKYDKDTIGLGVVLMMNNDGSYTSISMAPQLVNSTFTKLFYLDGHGTNYFDLIHTSKGMNNFRIKVWKVNWDGTDGPLIVERFNASNKWFGVSGEKLAMMKAEPVAEISGNGSETNTTAAIQNENVGSTILNAGESKVIMATDSSQLADFANS